MTKTRRRKPVIVQVSPEETLVVFPMRPGATLGTTCCLHFDQVKHLLSDRPLRPRYLGEPRAKLRDEANAKRSDRPSRKPKASRSRRPKPRAK